MIALRLLTAAALAAGAFLAGAGAAHAETSGFPVGNWLSPDHRKALVVGADGYCTLSPGVGKLDVAGPCTWRPYHKGGRLTIVSDNPAAMPEPMTYEVLWFGDSMIQVNNDVYALQG